jgi:alkanesulfonate monooxygenase SsuD/methylene tetrahydromethanopterin reductase-like flavin-dependent oxidoreductase (luciferase family)
VRYAISFSPAGPAGDPLSMAELAAEAERAGWDAVLIEDYIAYQGEAETPTYDPWVSMAAMAVATDRILLGTCVTPVPRRRPWKLAAEAVTLDHLSRGRLVLGVGAGDTNDPGFAVVGEPAATTVRAELLDEGLELLAALWTGEPVHFTGRHYRVDGLRLAATPVQQPRIPIWIGGDVLLPGVRARVARWDGSCAYKGSPTAEWRDMGPDDVARIRSAAGARPFDVCVGGRQRAEDWDREREHIRSVAAAGATWWCEWVKPGDRRQTVDAVRRGPLRVE